MSLQATRALLLRQSPALGVQRSMGRVDSLRQRLETAAGGAVTRATQRLGLAARTLDSVSPLATLERGYSIITDASSGRILTNASTVEPGTNISARLATGSLEATVTKAKDVPNAAKD